jgi:DGQHR domain-containing protein
MPPRKSIKRISYPALLLSQNKVRFYFATIPVDDLFPSCFVSRRDEDALAGFQRALNEPRADDIARYLASGSGSIPSNIVLSAQASAGFTYDHKNKSLSFEPGANALLVLDGQHRLWGYQKCRLRHRVPVAIYQSLTRADEAKLFMILIQPNAEFRRPSSLISSTLQISRALWRRFFASCSISCAKIQSHRSMVNSAQRRASTERSRALRSIGRWVAYSVAASCWIRIRRTGIDY